MPYYTMNHFMLNKEMIVLGSTYWNMVHGKNVGDVLGDDEVKQRQ